jgi:hypothetical protein
MENATIIENETIEYQAFIDRLNELFPGGSIDGLIVRHVTVTNCPSNYVPFEHDAEKREGIMPEGLYLTSFFGMPVIEGRCKIEKFKALD